MRVFYCLLVSLFISSNTFAQCPEKTEQEWKTYFSERINELDPIEGIWSISYSRLFYWDNEKNRDDYHANSSISAIYRNGNVFQMCQTDKKQPTPIFLTKTSIDNIYLYDNLIDGIHFKTNAKLTLSNVLEYARETPFEAFKKDVESGKYINDDGSNTTTEQKAAYLNYGKEVHKFTLIKVYPLNTDNFNSVSGSGTGFALTSNGYIVTNNHVVNGARIIKVKGIYGNFQKAYDAKVITVDKNNDLAIIQIDDPSFTSLGKIPYTISSKTSDAGSAIFVLGYPLRASMGDEIKLTNGIISSKSGYQGDITTYQISAPLQPGNSGGPMFDSKGNIIGVVNAKLVGAENASYAIKTSYLLNLIETLPTVPKLQNVNVLAGKPLTEQVKAVKNFTYIIEVK